MSMCEVGEFLKVVYQHNINFRAEGSILKQEVFMITDGA